MKINIICIIFDEHHKCNPFHLHRNGVEAEMSGGRLKTLPDESKASEKMFFFLHCELTL